MSDEEIKRIDIKEFRERGYLQEVNRCFLHPLGMALEVQVNDDGTEQLGGVWDYRDDPEGMNYEGGDLKPKAELVEAEWDDKLTSRMKAIGYMVQPCGGGLITIPQTYVRADLYEPKPDEGENK